jgi:hypothetical protein
MSEHASKLGAVRTASEEAQRCSRLLVDGITDDDDGKKREQVVLSKQRALVEIIREAREVLADSKIGVDR